MKLFTKIFCVVALAFSALPALAQTEVGIPWTGESGITETVAKIMERNSGENRPPRRKGPPHKLPEKTEQAPGASEYPFFPNLGQAPDGDLTNQVAIPFALSTSFTAATVSESGYYPPDTNFAVGPTQIGVALNGRLKFFTKAGVQSALNSDIDIFFNSVRNGAGCSDPRIRFDRISNRWFICMINIPLDINGNILPNRVLLAVSSGPTITNSTSFTFYQFAVETVGTVPNGDAGGWLDYPSMGVDEDAVYIAGNIFDAAQFGVTEFVIRKSSVLSGGPIVVTAFRNMDDGTDSGVSMMGVDRDATGTNDGYFIGASDTLYSRLIVHRIGDPGGTPTVTRFGITTASTNGSDGAPVLGTTRKLDTIEDRIFAASIRRNRLTGVETLWVAHNFTVSAAGIAVNTNAVGARVASRWYQIRNFTTTPAMVQSGTVFDSAVNNPNFYIIPSVIQNGQGHALLTFSDTSAIKNAGISMAGRLGTDTLGLMSDVTNVIAGASTYVDPFEDEQRWGDYSNCAVDPTDDQSFWSAQEFVSATNTWAVRVFKVLAPLPAVISTVSPNTLSAGQTGVTVTINGTATGGRGFFDPGTGFTNRLAASLGAGVTITSVTFVSPTQMQIVATVAANATAGARTLTVTNPDGQTSTSSFTITAPNNAAPTLTSISPTVVTSLRSSFTLTVNGSNFINGSIVNVAGSPRVTTFVSATQLTAAILASDILTSGTRSITVVTPTPGGGTSAAQTLTIGKTTISGVIGVPGYLPGPIGLTPTILLYNGVTNIPITVGALNAGGGYSFSVDVAPGTYSVFAKDSHWLRATGTVIVTPPSTATAGSITLINGDIDNDNFIGLDDFNELSNSFNLGFGDAGYNANADLDGDDFVGLDDFNILSNNFNVAGIDLP